MATQVNEIINMAREFQSAMEEQDQGRMDTVFDYFDEVYGPDKGPAAFNLSKQLVNSQGTAQIPLLKELEALIPEPRNTRPKPDLNAFATGVANMGLELTKYGDTPAEAALVRRQQNGLSENHPTAGAIGRGLGEFVPALAAEVALNKIPMGRQLAGAAGKIARGAWNPVTQGAAAGAIEGGLHGEKDAVQSAALGAGGAALGGAVGHVLGRTASTQQPGIQELVKKQQDKGYWANPGLRTGAISDKQLDNAMAKNSRTGPIVAEKMDANQKRFNMEVGKEMGLENATDLNIDTILAQSENLGKSLDTFYASYVPKFSTRDNLQTGNIASRYRSATGEDKTPKEYLNFVKRYDNLVKLSKGSNAKKYAPRLFRTLKRDVSNRMTYHYTAANGDPHLADAYKGIDRLLDKAIDRAAPEDALKQWRSQREQYAFLKEAIADKSMLISGNANPDAMIRMYNARGKANLGYMKKRKELLDSARFMVNQKKSFMPSFAMTQKLSGALEDLGASTGFSFFNRMPGASSLPLIGELYTRAYLKGYPGVTGLMNLPAGAKQAGARAGGALGVSFAPGTLGQ